jgi:hypothetical protein
MAVCPAHTQSHHLIFKNKKAVHFYSPPPSGPRLLFDVAHVNSIDPTLIFPVPAAAGILYLFDDGDRVLLTQSLSHTHTHIYTYYTYVFDVIRYMQ